MKYVIGTDILNKMEPHENIDFFMLFKKSELHYRFHGRVYGFRVVSSWLTKNLYFVCHVLLS